jgi:nitrogen fixation protein NifX
MSSLSKDVALRIALASRALPGVDVQRLVRLLHDRLGTPLDENALSRITVTDLKTGLGSADGEEDGEDLGAGLANLKAAVQILWGVAAEEALPPLEPALSGTTGVVRVAVASNSEELLNGHFGTCLRFLVYDLSASDCRLVDIRGAAGCDLSDDKNAARADLIADSQVLFVVGIGGPAAAKVIRRSIYPIKREGGGAREVLGELQQTFHRSPPPWLAKILGVDARRLHDSADELSAGAD